MAGDAELGSFVVELVPGEADDNQKPLWTSDTVKTRAEGQAFSLNRFTRFTVPQKKLQPILDQAKKTSGLWLRVRRVSGQKVKIILVGTC